MTEMVWLLVANPRRVADGAVQTVRLAGGGSQGYKQFGAVDWMAGLERPPAIAQKLGFPGKGFGEGAVIQASELRWRGSAARQATLGAYYWGDATFTLYGGPDGGADAAFSVLLSGRIADARPVGRGELVLQLVDPTADLAKPVVTDTFAGTGGIEGPAELKGQPKWRAWGKCRNVTLRSLKAATNIWVATDPSRPLQAIDQVYDRGNAASSLMVVAWAGSIAATLAALESAAAPAGGAAVAPSIGCVKWWYANPGKLTCDLRGEIGAGYIDRPADIAAALSAAVGGPAVNAAMLAAARAARNGEAGLLIEEAGVTAAEQIEQILSGVSLWWALSAAGEIEMGEWVWGAPVATIKAASVERSTTFQPVSKVTVRYRPNNTVMSRGDIAVSVLATEATYADGTPIEALKPAEAGANVTGTNVAAGIAGQGALATQNTVKVGTNITNPSGTVLTPEQLLNNTLDGATGIVRVSFPVGGQKSWDGSVTGALRVDLPWGSASALAHMVGMQIEVFDYASGSGNVNVQTYLISGYTYYPDGNWYAATAKLIGGGGAAKAVRFGRTGTRWSIWIGEPGTIWSYPRLTISDVRASYGSPSLPLFETGWNIALDAAAATNISLIVATPTPGDAVFGVNALESWNGAVATLPNFKTPLGTAAAISGQGSLATLNNVTYSTQITGLPGALQPANLYSGSIGSQWLYDPTSGTLMSNRWPAEFGANVTESRTAAAIAGQGTLATLNNVAWASQVSGRPTPLTDLTNIAGTDRFKADYVWSPTYSSTINARWPAELGANVTETRTAAAITGQGSLATLNNVAWGSQVSGRPTPLTDLTNIAGTDRFKSDYVWSSAYSSTIEGRWPAELGANVTESRTAAAITGQGGLATRNNARVGWELVDEAGAYLPPAYIKNNNNTATGSGFVARPVGGEYSNNTPNLNGAIQIKLPNTIGDGRFCMIKFQVDIFDYNTGTTVTYDIAGYLYAYGPGPGWVNCTAKAVGGSVSVKPVRFGRTGNASTDRFCVWIGDVSPASVWQYPQVQVRNVVTGYSYYDIAYWQAGWELTLVTAAFPAVDVTVTNPTASDAVFGVNALESWNGAVATLPNFKTPLGTAAAIAGQGALATQNALAYGGGFLTGFGTLAGRSNARFGTEIYRANGVTLVNDADAITALGIASAIVGQGTGATANTLAQLDASAAAALAAAANGGQQSVGINVIRSLLLDNGATVNFETFLSVASGGSGGNVQVRVERSPADTGTWTTIATYTGDFAGPTEPGTVTGTGSFTNTTGTKQRFDFRAVRANPAVGGALVSAQSYLKI